MIAMPPDKAGRSSPRSRTAGLGRFMGAGSRRRADGGVAHTRFVRWMRLALPVAAFLIVAVVFAWPEMDAPVLPDGKGAAGTGSRNEVVAPRFESRDEDRQPYTITAARAAQDPEDTDLIRLDKPVADMTLNSGKWLAGQADQGVFSQSRRILVLQGHVRLNHDDGYELFLERVSIDLRSRTAASDAPVRGHGPAGLVEAQGFTAEMDGRRLVFLGPARLVLNRVLPGL